jgi:small subunit ribosomal protein S6
MQAYETIFILQPELTEEDAESVAKLFEQVLADAESTLVKSERWGKKRLAYRVRKFWEGYYVFFEHASTPDLRIHEHVIKWISVSKDPRAEAEEARKAAKLARIQQQQRPAPSPAPAAPPAQTEETEEAQP